MTIDQCYQGVISKLTALGKIKDVSRKLMLQTTNDARVLYVYELLESLHYLPSLELVNKSKNVSTYYRNLGNEHYTKNQNFEAWQFYNLSILRAPYKSDSYCLALSNRSAVLFAFEKYEECLKDIESVLAMEAPSKIKQKLNKRREKCQEFILKKEKPVVDTKDTEIQNLLTIKSSRDPRHPSASSKLQVVSDQYMGRHVIAKADIQVGEVLVEEDPYFVLVLKQQMLFCCNYCLKRYFNLIPCENCCFAFYCSEQCKESAWRDYHAVECPLMASLIDMNFTKLELLALRTVIKARSDHTTWDSLFQTIIEAEATINTEYHGHVKLDNKWVYESKYYASIHTLESNIDKRSISDIFQKAITAVVFLKYLTDGTDFLKGENVEKTDKIRRCVAGTLLLHIMTSPTNMHGISSNIQNKEGYFLDVLSIASAPYAYHSLLNHSCAPNVVRYSELGSGRMKLFALRPIKKGKQLFDNYGPHHALVDCSTRQASLKFQYKFNCVCEACVNDWPMYLTMEPSSTIPRQLLNEKDKVLASDTIESLQKGDKEVALKVYKPLCRLCEDLEPYSPCKELSHCQEALKQCLVIFEGVVLYGHTEIISWEAKVKY